MQGSPKPRWTPLPPHTKGRHGGPRPPPPPTTAQAAPPPRPHHAPGLVVVQVHQEAQIAALLAGIHEFPAEEPPEIDVIAAASPVPIGAAGAAPAIIASARLDGALGAGARHRVRHAGAGDGEDERRLPAPCGRRARLGALPGPPEPGPRRGVQRGDPRGWACGETFVGTPLDCAFGAANMGTPRAEPTGKTFMGTPKFHPWEILCGGPTGLRFWGGRYEGSPRFGPTGQPLWGPPGLCLWGNFCWDPPGLRFWGSYCGDPQGRTHEENFYGDLQDCPGGGILWAPPALCPWRQMIWGPPGLHPRGSHDGDRRDFVPVWETFVGTPWIELLGRPTRGPPGFCPWRNLYGDPQHRNHGETSVGTPPGLRPRGNLCGIPLD